MKIPANSHEKGFIMKRHLAIFLFLLIVVSSLLSQPYFPDAGQVYRTDVIPRVDITLSEDTLQWIYDNPESRKEWKARFIFTAGGIADTIRDVGFRLRGMTSRYAAKKCFKVSFNTFTPGGKFRGIEKMNLNGDHNDPCIVRSHLTLNLFELMQVPAPRSNHVEVYINDSYYGLYINTEHEDEEFVESRFGNNLGNLYKCLYPADLNYLGSNPEDYKNHGYTLKTNTGQDNYDDLINFIYTLDKSTPEQFPAEIEPIFNVNGFLRQLAVEVFTGHWDGYSYNENNYYLFNNLNTGKFEYIPYDMDNTFGIDWVGVDWGPRDIYHWWKTSESRPLTSKIFGNQIYKDRFSFFLEELITQYASVNTYFPEIDNLKSKIDASAEADEYRPLDYGWKFEDYNRSYTEALGGHVKYGLKPYITTRINSINEQLVLNPIAPIIENVFYTFPQLSRPVQVRLNITDDQADPVGKLYYQVNDGIFNMILLTHDADNKYLAEIPGLSETGVVKFYIDATDASNNTTREPSVGEYNVPVGVSNPVLMITEFMSSNTNTIVDNYGAAEDWIEIKNISSSAVSLDGKYLTDDLARRNRFKLPAVTLEPGQFYLVWADDDTEQGPNHANFKLDAGGESIGLFDSYETNFAPLFTLDYLQQGSNISSGTNTSGVIVPQTFITPGGENNSTDVAFITFRFNMNKQITDGNFNPASDFIDVAGTFNSWEGDDRVYDGNNDGIYQYTAFGFTTNETIEYKARINANWSTAEFPEPGGEGNRVYTLLSGHNIIEHWYNDDFVTGINNDKTDGMLTVFPNPTSSGNFAVEATFSIESVRIYSLTGELCYQKEISGSNKVYVHVALHKGMYLVKVTGNNREYISKLMVIEYETLF
jgi:spore coat protein H